MKQGTKKMTKARCIKETYSFGIGCVLGGSAESDNEEGILKNQDFYLKISQNP